MKRGFHFSLKKAHEKKVHYEVGGPLSEKAFFCRGASGKKLFVFYFMFLSVYVDVHEAHV